MKRDLLTGRYLKQVTFNESFFAYPLTPEKVWLLGLLGADGNVKDDEIFSLNQSHERGKKLLLKIAQLLNYSGQIYWNESVDSHQLYFNSKQAVKFLLKFGIRPRKTLIFEYPRIPKSLDWAFIRGYVDGDGSAGVYEKKNPTGSTCQELCISWVGTPEFLEVCKNKIPIDLGINKCYGSDKVKELRAYGEKANTLALWLWNTKSNIPCYYKEEIWRMYLETNNPRWLRFAKPHSQAIKLFEKGISVPLIATELELNQFTVYVWRRKYFQQKKILGK